MTLRQGTRWVATVAVLAIGSLGPASANAAPSCVGQFVMAAAPQSAGAFGQFAQEAAKTTEPNLGLGDVSPDATSDHSSCP